MTTNTQTNNRFITPLELSQQLAISRSTVTRWIAEGRIPVRRIGPRSVRILRTDVQELLAKVADKVAEN